MRKIITTLALFSFSASLFAQDAAPVKDTTYWKKGGTFGISGTQTSLTNWAAGGQNSVAIGSIVNLFANYKKDKMTWDNNLDLAYGVIRQGNVKNFLKNDDRIQLTSKYGQYAFKHWYYSGLLDFKTQFDNGFDDPTKPDSVRKVISSFLAPAYTLVALGMDYKPNANFTLFIAPITGKITIVNNQTLANAGAFGVDKAVYDASLNIVTLGKKHREEFGGYVKMGYKFSPMENVTFNTNLELFSNYLNNPGNIDVSWTTLTSMKVNKYISATFSTHLIYDDDIKITDSKGNSGPRTQFKEVLGVGFSYKF